MNTPTVQSESPSASVGRVTGTGGALPVAAKAGAFSPAELTFLIGGPLL